MDSWHLPFSCEPREDGADAREREGFFNLRRTTRPAALSRRKSRLGAILAIYPPHVHRPTWPRRPSSWARQPSREAARRNGREAGLVVGAGTKMGSGGTNVCPHRMATRADVQEQLPLKQRGPRRIDETERTCESRSKGACGASSRLAEIARIAWR